MAEQDPLVTDSRNKCHVKPSETASSYFFFIPLIRHADGETASHRCGTATFAWFLLVLTYVMQLSMLWAVGGHVVTEREEWMNSVIRFKDIGDEVGCGDKEALCLHVDGQYSCGPKSVQMYGRWDKLDLDGDGVWSEDEAGTNSTRNSMICRYGIDSLVFFKFLLNQLRTHPVLLETGLLHSNVTTGHAIHKAYFDWFKADAVMCAYGDSDMCGNLFQKGIFDAPMKYAGISHMINDTDSAWQYCNSLLKNDGRCMSMLPSTYRIWRINTNEQCGKKTHNPFVYANPRKEDDVISLSQVDFEKREEYAQTETFCFGLFLWCILLTFYLSLLYELREAMRFAVWVAFFPARALSDDDFVADESGVAALRGIHKSHRLICAIILFIKAVMIVIVAYVGTVFLLSETDYVSLLFDAVGLVFIIQVDGLLYQTLVRQSAKDQLESIPTMQVGDSGLQKFYLSSNGAFRDIFWAVALFLATYVVLSQDYNNRIQPLQKALECACVVTGGECHEAIEYSKTWWDEYWRQVAPACLSKIQGFVAAAHAPRHHVLLY